MKKNYRKAMERLDLFLADTEGQSKEAVADELKAQGTDVTAFLGDVNALVRKGYQGSLKEIAANEREAVVRSRKTRFAGLAGTKEQMLLLVARLQRGDFGINLRERAVARCRNQDPATLSEEDLRSWLEDIDASEASGVQNE
jgi:hypothetical protein